ncbi:transposase [Rhodococcus sp. WS4]|nr:transposase [Rhodococcus sp. WS4]
MAGNVDNLRKAAAAKRDAATKRAEEGLRHAIRIGAPITFEGVAAHASVSKDFLYRTPALRARIEQLRRQQAGMSPVAPSRRRPDRGLAEDANSIVLTLTAKLAEERERYRRDVTQLKAELSAAHGRILELSRRAVQPPE